MLGAVHGDGGPSRSPTVLVRPVRDALSPTRHAIISFMTADGVPAVNKPDASVEVVDHDGSWGTQFEAEAQELRNVLAPVGPRVEHIGSTAVPGIPAKPTIDVLVLVDDVEDVLVYRDALKALGYEYRPASLTSSDDQLFFRKVAASGKRTHHLHVVARRSPKGHEYLAFRDYLRTHGSEARAYAALKLDLAERFATERMRYVDEKARYVDELMERVRAWAESRR